LKKSSSSQKKFFTFFIFIFLVDAELLPLQSFKKGVSFLREEKRERLKKSLLKAQKYFGCNE